MQDQDVLWYKDIFKLHASISHRAYEKIMLKKISPTLTQMCYIFYINKFI